MNEKVMLVVPIKNEFKAIFDFMENIKEYYFGFIVNNISLNILFVDDTSDSFDRYYKTTNSLIDENKYIKRMRGCGSYGESVKVGLINSVNNDIIILMDIDHPLNLLNEFVDKMLYYDYDMVIGQDNNNGFGERIVTKLICRYLFGIKQQHPTCGYMGFTKNTLLWKIPFYRANSRKDVIHLEFLYMAIKNKLNISESYFNTKGVYIKHNYNVKRNLIWLYDVVKMKIYDILYNYYFIDSFINEKDVSPVEQK